jgi:hypothetical protein
LSLIIAPFSKVWSSFFYWPAFHGFIILFGVLFVLSFGFQRIYHLIFAQIKKPVLHVCSIIQGWTFRDWLKIGLILIVLGFALPKEIGLLNFIVLSYALTDFILLDSRYAAGTALVFSRLSCTHFLKNWAESSLFMPIIFGNYRINANT